MNTIKRIIVTLSAASYSKTTDIINRARTLSINNITFIPDEQPLLPDGLNNYERYEYLKETLVVTTRKSTPFVTTFASPGKIVEDLGSILTLNWHCSYNCQFCYLIGSMYQRQWQEVYVNIDDLEKQIVLEQFVHCSILTIWTMLSRLSNEKLVKIPKNLKQTADWLRKRFIIENIDSDQKAKDFLDTNLDKIFNRLDQNIDHTTREQLTKSIPQYYQANRKNLPWLNVSEYTDFLAIDPLTDFSSDLIRMLDKYPELQISMRTKSTNVTNLLMCKSKSRLKIAINLNTKYAIDNYEIGAASLIERIDAAKKIQAAKGIQLKIVVEPIMVYNGYKSDYLQLIDQIKKEINLDNVIDFSFGAVRYKTKLVNQINKFIPQNNLFMNDANLINYPKDRIRYHESIRKNIYQMIIKELKSHKNLVIRLSAETPEMWDEIGLNKEAHIAKSVSQ
ncbi:MAG: hypothetical protein NTX65_12365 [Ignavibacteriales bacterium]|nr:hypothetical protein [Ignavibacteriales bacterium]